MECNLVWARRNNIPEEKVTDIDEYAKSAAFTDREKAVFLLSDWMAHHSKGKMDKETLDTLHKHFKDEEIVELGSYFAFVSGFQKFNNVFRILYRRED